MASKTITKSSFVRSKSTVEPYGVPKFVLFNIYLRISSAQETILSNEDEELIANIQENRVSVSYNFGDLKNAKETYSYFFRWNQRPNKSNVPSSIWNQRKMHQICGQQ